MLQQAWSGLVRNGPARLVLGCLALAGCSAGGGSAAQEGDSGDGSATDGSGNGGGGGGGGGTNGSASGGSGSQLSTEGFSCTTAISCVESAPGTGWTPEELESEQARCGAEGQWELGGDCGSAPAFASCAEAERITHYTLIAAGSSLEQLEERCLNREASWQPDPEATPVAELSVGDIETHEAASNLFNEIIPLSELSNFCADSEDGFGVGVTSNDATGFTRYHYFACFDGAQRFNQNHFKQLLRDSYETLEDFEPSPETYARIFSIGDNVFFVTGTSCWNCSYDFAGSSGTLLTVFDGELVDGVYQVTVRDNVGTTTTLTLPAVMLAPQ